MTKGNKNKARRIYDPLFSQTIKDAVAEFNVSETYVRNAVNKTENGGKSDEIRTYVSKKLAQYKSITNN